MIPYRAVLADTDVVRKLDDSGFIDRLYSKLSQA